MLESLTSLKRRPHHQHSSVLQTESSQAGQEYRLAKPDVHRNEQQQTGVSTPDEITFKIKMKGRLFRGRRASNLIESFEQSVDQEGRPQGHSLLDRHASSVLKTRADPHQLSQSVIVSGGPEHHRHRGCYACSQQSPQNLNHRQHSQGELHSVGADQDRSAA